MSLALGAAAGARVTATPRRLPRVPLGRSGVLSLMVLAIVGVSILIGPVIWTSDPNRTQLTRKFAPPSADAPLGRDELGRDLLARLLHGGRLSLPAALLVVLGTSGIGLLIGSAAALRGGRFDAGLRWVIDTLLAMPGLVIALALAGALGKSFPNLLIALIVAGWPWYARAYRTLVLRERERGYVLAARAVGASAWWIGLRHVLPNISGPILTLTTINLGNAMLSLTALSFLGLGVHPPQAEWGAMIASARSFFDVQPWVMLVPGLAISITVLAVNMLGDALHQSSMSPVQRSAPRSGS